MNIGTAGAKSTAFTVYCIEVVRGMHLQARDSYRMLT